MKITETLKRGVFLKRYKRFFADVLIDGQLVVAHVPNTGSLKTCLYPNSECVVSESTNPERKLKATLHFLKTPTSWVGVNTTHPNTLVHEAWQNRLFSHWHPFQSAQREFKINKETRLDMVLALNPEDLAAKSGLHHIEVKNVTWAENGVARFPDAVTERGQKHLRELMELKKKGFGAELVFVVQREDCHTFAPADDLDPVYGKLLREAHAAGVHIAAYAYQLGRDFELTLKREPLQLSL